MIDVSLAIDMESRNVGFKAKGSGSYVNGFYSGEYADQVTISAAVFSVSPRDLKDMPEGIRAEARKTIWTRADIAIDDQIIDGARTYRIIHLNDRKFEGGYNKAFMGLTK